MILNARERLALGNLCEVVDCDRVRIRRDPGDLIRSLVLAVSGGRAVALGNDVFLPAGEAGNVALLAHELTHCGQYQQWGPLTYYGRGLVDRIREVLHLRLGVGESPYRYAADDRPFTAYGMEQQGQIVEDCFNGDATAAGISPYRPASRTV
ncbi:MAG: DUF4157 domain-containing protein [Gemmatimonadales bacterium]|nr:DUF4157 domain-containing protein [Gemmatimonadales bacterium]